MMNIRTLEDLMAYAEFYALEQMHASGSCRPCLFFSDANGLPGIFVFGRGEFDEEGKEGFRYMARLACVAHAAVICVFVSEIWASIAMAKTGESPEEVRKRTVAERGIPSEDFERREMIMFAGETRQRRVCKVLPIIRSGNENFFGFGESDFPPLDTAKGDKYDGRFSHILPDRDAAPDIREMARLALSMHGINPQVVAVPLKK